VIVEIVGGGQERAAATLAAAVSKYDSCAEST
jgi:hypothetical protein